MPSLWKARETNIKLRDKIKITDICEYAEIIDGNVYCEANYEWGCFCDGYRWNCLKVKLRWFAQLSDYNKERVRNGLRTVKEK